MLFNSLHFTLFFILTTIIYFAISHKYRWALLLFISCYFYAIFVPIYILILLFTIIIDYYAGILIERNTLHKKKLLLLSIVVNVATLCFFKYYNFINENITQFLGLFSIKNNIPFWNIILPIGLSFHTFQAMSYTIEVYKGKQKAERHFGIYALYVMFYPQLVAGPIERPQNILHQFHIEHTLNYDRIISGLKLMLWGLFKKIVIADRLSIYVDTIYNNSQHHSGISSIVATIFFSIQIYCDFSGYSSIAIGAARVLGINLMENFKRPYLASSIKEFWNRWHVSLSTWFRDYVYIPLGGNKKGIILHIRNLFVVFFLSGLWHGANWTFVIWGIIHFTYLAIERLYDNIYIGSKKNKKFFSKFTKCLLTFFLTSFAWIFFRAKDITTANIIIKNIFTNKEGGLFIGNASSFVYSVALIVFLLLAEINEEFYKNRFSLIYSKNATKRFIGYIILLIIILLIGVINAGQFIYFQF